MVEGITEKMLLPLMINKVAPELNKKYISILEVGGAYTHKFKELLNFIKVKTLVITDIDSVQLDNNRKACRVNTPNSVTSNSTLKNWIPKKDTIVDLISTRVEEKFDGKFIRVCYQIAENTENQYTARSLEEAIINRNLIFFKSKYNDLNEENTVIEIQVKSKFELLKNINFEETLDLYNLSPQKGEKSQFAFDLMTFKAGIEDLSWDVPKYIGEGLEWLEKDK
ncbi:ATP-dependent endonuclease [Chryseobacterium sp. YIM B02567]|uniref:ATP-dependent endonuclease n=2 Tax=Chryseobacterium paridis TaxID=2800328 RepID=A0ABS1FXM8_9FLAO|nr:ATP-dependent endonuclease [Chryseobacterium paridis]MBK1897191.1 ATP-dependent endonuclease [Chryseobacterium paridis]